jgi:hypothetical protein
VWISCRRPLLTPVIKLTTLSALDQATSYENNPRISAPHDILGKLVLVRYCPIGWRVFIKGKTISLVTVAIDHVLILAHNLKHFLGYFGGGRIDLRGPRKCDCQTRKASSATKMPGRRKRGHKTNF